MTWSERLQERGSALCVGLDPVKERLPAETDILSFCEAVIDVTAEFAGCFKPNIAFFERHGASGIEALERVRAACVDRDIPVILDAKRGDVGSTAQMYAEAYLQPGPLSFDAMTVNPGLGIDTLAPFLELSLANDRGIFVLLRTSNPGAAMFQETMEPGLIDFLRSEPLAGAVVGATNPEAGERLRAQLPDTLFLVPGFGRQGGSDLAPFFDAAGRGAVVNSSRAILFAGEGQDDWKSAVRNAAREARDTIEGARNR
ncbi:MAG: orotidine-5'-phosphate decarboxylase [Planctomycetota bacterium]|jgi:orotidine-5'-phosphate decarboxylase